MGKAAVDAAKAVGYVGAGTVEFIATAGRRLLLHGDEHAAAGRAPGHRDDHRPRPGRVAVARGQRRAAAAAPGATRDQRPRDGGAHLRRGSGPWLPAVHRPPGALGAAARDRSRARGHRRRTGRRDHTALRPDDRQADRLGLGSPPGAGPHAAGAGAVPGRRRVEQRRLPGAPGCRAVVRQCRPRHRPDRARAGAAVPARRGRAGGRLAARGAGRAVARAAPGREEGGAIGGTALALARARRLAPERPHRTPARSSASARRCRRWASRSCPAPTG